MADERAVQDGITAYWNLRGQSYDAQPGHADHSPAEHQAWLETLAALLPAAPLEVLDVGAGTGFVSLLLAELGHRVVGLDLAEGMLEQARDKAAGLARPPAFRLGDAMAPDLPPGSVDVVASRHLLWTLTDPARAFANWRRLLRPGGRVVAIDGLWWADGRPTGTDPPTEPWQIAWATHYSADVTRQLPLMLAESVEPAADLARAAGFAEVRVERLPLIEALDRSDSDRRPAARFAIVATAAA